MGTSLLRLVGSRPPQVQCLSGSAYGNRRTILKKYQLNQWPVAETEGFEPSIPR